jgi:sugar lactone lactonase YvrE
MKQLFTTLILASTFVASARSQTSLFDRYDVNSTNWAKLPSGEGWDGETPSVATDGKGTVVVLVRKAPHFRFFRTSGEFIRAWGGDEERFIYHNVFFGPDNSVWLVATNNHLLVKFSLDGQRLMTLGKKDVAGDNASKDAFNRPNAVAFGKNGEIFVADGDYNSRVVEFTKEGKFVRIIGGVKGSGPGELSVPHAIAIDRGGRILVADSGNQRISVFNSDGTFAESWPAAGQGGMSAGTDGTVYVSDVYANAIVVLKDGKIVDAIHVPGRPHAIALDAAANEIYVASTEPMKPNVFKVTRKQPAVK